VVFPPRGLGEVITTPYRKNWPCLKIGYNCLGPGLILWYNLNNGKKYEIGETERKVPIEVRVN